MEQENRKWIPALVFVLAFLVSLLLFNYLLIGRHSKSVSEMSGASLPLLTVTVDDNQLNTLHGYTGEMDKSLLRDSIIPLETNYSFDVTMTDASEDIASVSYKIYETDNKTVHEKGISSFRKNKKKTVATVTLTEKLDTGKTYLAELTLETSRGVDIYYYTRIKYGPELHFSECMDFINQFHDATIAGGTDGNNLVSRYIEPKDSYQNNDLSKVDLYSNADVICYAGMKPKVEKNFGTKVTEISNDLTNVEIQTLLSFTNSDGDKQYYMATEYYKIQYTVSRTYLMGYERTMEEYFQYDSAESSKNRFRLGITQSSSDKQLHTSNKCEYAAFVQQDQLWMYDYQQGEMVSVFSFIGDDYRDLRNNYSENGIKIMNLDKKGNLTFLVYGYMNRGSHEGENGICVYKFNCSDRANEEILFIPTSLPYDNINEDMQALSYLDKNNNYYFYMDGSIYKVNPEEKEHSVIQTDIANTDLVSSEDGIYALKQGKNIVLYDMAKGKKQKIKAGSGKTLVPIGFIGSDLVYGIANTSDITTKTDGTKSVPMTEVKIVGTDLYEKTSYSQDGIYILSASIDNTTVQLKRAEKSGSGYKKLVDDYIHFKEETSEKITFEYAYSSSIYNQLYMKFPTLVYVSDPKLVTAKEEVSGNYKTITFEENDARTDTCYVYAKSKMIGSYTSVSKAIKVAKKNSGVVVDSNQHYIWENGAAKSYAKVPSVSIVKASSKDQSLAACVQMLLKLNADDTSLSTLEKENKTPIELLNKYFNNNGVNLSGCKLDDIVYYISEGRPLIAQLKNGRYVVLMSYNSTKLRYIDPVKGESIQADRAKLEKNIKAGGSKYYSYTD